MSKFLTYEERLTIARLVNDGATFTEIAKAVGKSSSTIAKEIKKDAYEKKTFICKRKIDQTLSSAVVIIVINNNFIAQRRLAL